jgi:hypothetical protein
VILCLVYQVSSDAKIINAYLITGKYLLLNIDFLFSFIIFNIKGSVMEIVIALMVKTKYQIFVILAIIRVQMNTLNVIQVVV